MQVHLKAREGSRGELGFLALRQLLLHLLGVFQLRVELVKTLDRLSLDHFLNGFSVHWILSKGVVLHRLDLALVSSGPLVDDVGVVHLEVVQLLLAEVDVQVPVKVVRGSRGERLSIDVDDGLLAHVEPDHLVDALTSGGGHLLQDFLETSLAWLACPVDWKPVDLKSQVCQNKLLEGCLGGTWR